MSGTRKSRRPRSKKRRRGRAGPPDPRMPQERLDPLLHQINSLIQYHEQKWPDGVNPEKFLKAHVDPVVRWYNSGERGPKMYRRLKELLRLLSVTSAEVGDDE